MLKMKKVQMRPEKFSYNYKQINPFTIKWANPLSIVFSYFPIVEGLEYRSLSKLFNDAIKNNLELTLRENTT